MKLQLLVPQYNETDEVIKPLLDSVSLQQNVPFEEIGVIICNDGSDVFLSEEFLRSYPFQIEYYKEPHRGISGARNACLDYAIADYVMFCDADDMFLSVCGLYQIFVDIEQGFDSLICAFVEETRDRTTREVVYGEREYDCTFVHGKVHRRQYLIEQNIRFKDELIVNEDSYFTVLTQNLTDNLKICKKPIYLWRWREDSVTRNDPLHKLKSYHYMIDSNEALVDELIKRGLGNRACYYVVCMVLNTYFELNKPKWLDPKNKQYRDSTEAKFARYYLSVIQLWESVPIKERLDISNQLRDKAIKDGMEMEVISLPDWLNHLLELARRNYEY